MLRCRASFCSRQVGGIFAKLHAMKTKTPLLFATLALLCLAATEPKAQAVSPPPDGGYPGGNTAEGQSALLSRTTGIYNTAVGIFSVLSLTDGNFCTGVGAGTLLSNTADQNTATGAGALLSNTIGDANTANGAFALFANTEGIENTATGDSALLSNTTGDGNTATGFSALNGNTTGFNNTANGGAALGNNTIGSHNTADGVSALALNTTGSNNTALGELAGIGVTTASNVIAIGTSGANVSDSCFIGNIRDVTTAIGDAIPVLIDSAGQLGTASSSRRFKNEIKPMDQTSEAILSLKPVTFHYKSDSTGTPQFGLIAEEVAAVDPGLVVRDKNGEIYTVLYDAVNAMLLNEFLKEHRKVEQLHATVAEQQKAFQATIAQQQNEIQALTASLKEQAAQIQKVTAQLELNKTAQQMVGN